eukprot:6935610-Pyramimonas_sp.AAC.1
MLLLKRRCVRSRSSTRVVAKHALKSRLRATAADILLAQEMGHLPDQIEAVTSWAQGRGWQMMALASYPTAGVLLGAGVAGFVRDGHGLRPPAVGTMQVWGHRIQHVVVDLASWPVELHIFNLYLFTGVGVGGKNAQLLARVGTIANSLDRPVIIAGDWNLPPGELNASNFPTLSGTIIRSSKAVMCRGGAGNKIIDYFAMNTAANQAFSDVRADLSRSKRPHRPVVLYLKGTAASMRKLVYTAAPSLGKNDVFGPQPALPCGRVAKTVTDAANRARCDGHVWAMTGWCLMSRAWARFASHAAKQIGGGQLHDELRCFWQAIAGEMGHDRARDEGPC